MTKGRKCKEERKTKKTGKKVCRERKLRKYKKGKQKRRKIYETEKDIKALGQEKSGPIKRKRVEL